MIFLPRWVRVYVAARGESRRSRLARAFLDARVFAQRRADRTRFGLREKRCGKVRRGRAQERAPDVIRERSQEVGVAPTPAITDGRYSVEFERFDLSRTKTPHLFRLLNLPDSCPNSAVPRDTTELWRAPGSTLLRRAGTLAAAPSRRASAGRGRGRIRPFVGTNPASSAVRRGGLEPPQVTPPDP